MTPGDRLKFIAENILPRKRDLADMLGMKPESLYDYFNNVTRIGRRMEEKLHSIGINTEWLFSGRGTWYVPGSELGKKLGHLQAPDLGKSLGENQFIEMVGQALLQQASINEQTQRRFEQVESSIDRIDKKIDRRFESVERSVNNIEQYLLTLSSNAGTPEALKYKTNEPQSIFQHGAAAHATPREKRKKDR